MVLPIIRRYTNNQITLTLRGPLYDDDDGDDNESDNGRYKQRHLQHTENPQPVSGTESTQLLLSVTVRA